MADDLVVRNWRQDDENYGACFIDLDFMDAEGGMEIIGNAAAEHNQLVSAYLAVVAERDSLRQRLAAALTPECPGVPQ